jgi:ribosomal protein S14
MISKLKYIKGINSHNKNYNLWDNDTYLPSLWRPVPLYKNKLRMRCFITGRFSAVDRKFYLTRMQWKFFAKGGYLPGVKKSSW